MFKKLFSLKKSVAVLLSVVLLFSLAQSFSTAAKSTSQMRNEIADLESKSKQLESKIAQLKKQKAAQDEIKAALQEQITATQSEINACVSTINGYKAEISECQKKIDQKQKEIEETKYTYKKRMRSISMSGSTNNDLLVLMDSSSFSEYLALSEVSSKISSHDKKLLNEITEALAVINASKAEINQKLSAQNDVKAKLATKQAALKAQQSEINSVINSINTNKASLEKENKSYENAINSLENEIQKALSAANSGSGGTATPVFTSGQFTWPCPGYYNLTSNFGTRWGRLHGGVDISSAGINGKPIVAAADGVVIAAGFNRGGYGNWVMINHGKHGGNNFATVYGHMISSPCVSTGQTVKAGQHIGNVGSTGDSTGPHLHFEIRVNGNRVNPMAYFNRAK